MNREDGTNAFLVIVSTDNTPGGAANALLLETSDGILLEDGSFLLLEA